MARTGCGQHAQRIGRKLDLCMPINEARRRSLESRGACTLSDRCSETRHELETRTGDTPTKTLSTSLARAIAASQTSAISTHSYSNAFLPAFLHTSLARPLCKYPNTIVVLFLLRLTRGLPAQQASSAAASSQPALPHRHTAIQPANQKGSHTLNQGRTI